MIDSTLRPRPPARRDGQKGGILRSWHGTFPRRPHELRRRRGLSHPSDSVWSDPHVACRHRGFCRRGIVDSTVPLSCLAFGDPNVASGHILVTPALGDRRNRQYDRAKQNISKLPTRLRHESLHIPIVDVIGRPWWPCANPPHLSV